MENLKETYLSSRHREWGAKMVVFAGYHMPLQYKVGIVKEHLFTRTHAGLFDVSHMGKLRLKGKDASKALEQIVGADISGLKAGKWCYTQLLNQEGGIEDDLLVGRDADDPEQILHVVVNASRKVHDQNLIASAADAIGGVAVEVEEDVSLLALQGPSAAAVLEKFFVGVSGMGWMEMGRYEFAGSSVLLSRSGYTGNDGFEILVSNQAVVSLVERLLLDDEVMLCGLGARNTLRLEAGLCLYGNDIDAETTPIEAGLQWSLSKKRLSRGDIYNGVDKIRAQQEQGVEKIRIGLQLGEKTIARDGTLIYNKDGKRVIGKVTSGVFSPQLSRGIAMGYVEKTLGAVGTLLACEIRGRFQEATVVSLPFVKGLR